MGLVDARVGGVGGELGVDVGAEEARFEARVEDFDLGLREDKGEQAGDEQLELGAGLTWYLSPQRAMDAARRVPAVANELKLTGASQQAESLPGVRLLVSHREYRSPSLGSW